MGLLHSIVRTIRGLFQRLLVRLGGYAIALLIAFGAVRDNPDLQDGFGEFVVVGAVFGGAMLLLACVATTYSLAWFAGLR